MIAGGVFVANGFVARRMADKGVNIRVQYSDHDHQLILVVDNLERGREVAEEWPTPGR